MKLTEEDTIRLLEARHDIKAVADPATLTPDEKFWEGIEASRDELADAREALSRAISHNTQEMGETDTERAKLQTALRTARESYRYYRGRTQDALFNLAPGVHLSPEESQRRQRLFDRIFALNHSELSNVGVASQVEILDALLTAHEDEPELKALGFGPALADAICPAIEIAGELSREVKEDEVATSKLNEARANFDRAHRAHIQLIDSLLTRQNRNNRSHHFIKRREPAYAARRRAKVPVAQEPEAPAIESEVVREEPTPA